MTTRKAVTLKLKLSNYIVWHGVLVVGGVTTQISMHFVMTTYLDTAHRPSDWQLGSIDHQASYTTPERAHQNFILEQKMDAVILVDVGSRRH